MKRDNNFLFYPSSRVYRAIRFDGKNQDEIDAFAKGNLSANGEVGKLGKRNISEGDYVVLNEQGRYVVVKKQDAPHLFSFYECPVAEPPCVQNMNPGNLKHDDNMYVGEVTSTRYKTYRQFESMAYGFRALLKVIDKKFREGKDTARSILYDMDRPKGMDRIALIEKVCDIMKVSPDEKLSKNSRTYKGMAKAIFLSMCGSYRIYNCDKYLEDGYRLCKFVNVSR